MSTMIPHGGRSEGSRLPIAPARTQRFLGTLGLTRTEIVRVGSLHQKKMQDMDQW